MDGKRKFLIFSQIEYKSRRIRINFLSKRANATQAEKKRLFRLNFDSSFKKEAMEKKKSCPRFLSIRVMLHYPLEKKQAFGKSRKYAFSWIFDHQEKQKSSG